MGDFIKGIIDNLSDDKWLAGEASSWLLFVLAIGALSSVFNALIAWCKNKKYQNWTLKVVGYNDEPQNIYYEDVVRFKVSDFELLKFYKGIAGGACQHNVRSIKQVRDIWGFLDDAERTITVDLTKIPDSQVKSWNDGVGPALRPKTVADPVQTL